MTITTRDQLISALGNNSTRFVIDKAALGNSATGQLFSMWTATGVPGAGANPGAAAVPTNATVGALPFPNQTAPNTSYFAYAWMVFSQAFSSVEFYDRLAHMGGLNGTLTTAQTVGIDLGGAQNPGAARLGQANYSEVQFYLEVFTDMGATGVNATVNVTYDDASTGNLAAIALGATPRRGRLYALVPAVAGRSIRGVNTVTLSATTGTAGNFGFVAVRNLSAIEGASGNFVYPKEWSQLSLPQVPNDSCLFMVVPCTTTSTGTLRGQGKLAHG